MLADGRLAFRLLYVLDVQGVFNEFDFIGHKLNSGGFGVDRSQRIEGHFPWLYVKSIALCLWEVIICKRIVGLANGMLDRLLVEV